MAGVSGKVRRVGTASSAVDHQEGRARQWGALSVNDAPGNWDSPDLCAAVAKAAACASTEKFRSDVVDLEILQVESQTREGRVPSTAPWKKKRWR